MLAAWIGRALASAGISQRVAAKAAPWIALSLFALCVAAAGALAVHLIRADAVKDDRIEAELEAQRGRATADARAADQRLRDDRAQRDQEESYHEAVDNPRPGDSDDPGVRLACERLRRAGQDLAAIPACGGR